MDKTEIFTFIAMRQARIKKTSLGDEEMARKLRTLIALADYLGSVLITHTVAYNPLLLQFQGMCDYTQIHRSSFLVIFCL